MLNLIFGRKKSSDDKTPFRAYTGDGHYSFVSYAHVNSDIVFPIIKELNNRGILIWYDERIEAGEEWSQVIAERILNCDKFLLFISPDSISSHHVRQEINFANSKRKQILPIYLKPTKLNSGVEMTISMFQSIFYYAYKKDEDGFYAQTIKALTEGFVDAGAEVTVFKAYSELLLKLDEQGDQTLPKIIHLPDSGSLSIGRFDVSVGVQQSDFEFSGGTMNISRRHAVFECIGNDCYTVTDLGSMAGTWVNGQKIPPNTPQALEPGDSVWFGNGGARYILER